MQPSPRTPPWRGWPGLKGGPGPLRSRFRLCGQLIRAPLYNQELPPSLLWLGRWPLSCLPPSLQETMTQTRPKLPRAEAVPSMEAAAWLETSTSYRCASLCSSRRFIQSCQDGLVAPVRIILLPSTVTQNYCSHYPRVLGWGLPRKPGGPRLSLSSGGQVAL